MRTPDPKRLLLVAYDFPPIDSAGMQRIVSMAKYLTRAGWRVTVLTVRSSFVPRQTDASLELIPDGVEVVRTHSFELRRMIGGIRRWAFGPDADAFSDGNGEGSSRSRSLIAKPLLAILGRLNHVFGFPDSKIGWFVPLFFGAWRILRSGNVTIVLSSSPPHSLHLPLLFLRTFLAFRWVVDFRDPWTVPVEGRRNTRRFRRARALERRVLNRADAILANTRGNKAALLETFGGLVGEKVTVITNGFDTDRLPTKGAREKREITGDLVYTGFVYSGMLDSYLDAIRYLHRHGAYVPRLQVIGPRPSELTLDAETAPYVELHSYLPLAECLTVMRRARGLLLLVPYDRPTCVPSKLYPYLFSGTPVFALGPEGDAASILERTRTGRLVQARSPREIAEGLLSFLEFSNHGADGVEPDAVELERYQWSYLGARVDQVLQKVGQNSE